MYFYFNEWFYQNEKKKFDWYSCGVKKGGEPGQ